MSIFEAKNHNGAFLYEIFVPEIVEEKYLKVLPMPVNGQWERIPPVAVSTIIRVPSYERAMVEEANGKLLWEFVSDDGDKLDKAIDLAEKIGLPWCISGGSEVFDPATSRCWSYKTWAVIDQPREPLHQQPSSAVDSLRLDVSF